jgi:hypothetical protein
MTLAEGLAAIFGATPAPRLSHRQAAEIRRMFRAKAGFAAICKKFGITSAHARFVCGLEVRGSNHDRRQAKGTTTWKSNSITKTSGARTRGW